MPLLTSDLCNLLRRLEKGAAKTGPKQKSSPKWATKQERERIVVEWVDVFRDRIDECLVPFLSVVFPKERTDMVYGLQQAALSKHIEALDRIGETNRPLLYRWKDEPYAPDLAACFRELSKIYQGSSFRPRDAELSDDFETLLQLASRSNFSGPDVRRLRKGAKGLTSPALESLERLLLQRSPNDRYWLVKLILKNFGLVDIPRWALLNSIHPCLPCALKVRNCFEEAVAIIRQPEFNLEALPKAWSEERNALHRSIVPKLGTMVSRPDFLYGRSIDYICRMAQRRVFAFDTKYDGYFMQIHINLSHPTRKIQIFSRSKKDSTQDNKGVHDAIRSSLRLDQVDCRIKQNCIIEGELLPWSISKQEILPFGEISKHIMRAGSAQTREYKSPEEDERLMVVFFDVRMLDQKSLIHATYKERREILSDIVKIEPGVGGIAATKIVNFARPDARNLLCGHLAEIFAAREEGCVAKPFLEPSLDLAGRRDGTYRSIPLKIKKSYLPGLGDTVELVVLGASYDSLEATSMNLGLHGTRWTRFHIACLGNKKEVVENGAKPHFIVLDATREGFTDDFLGRFTSDHLWRRERRLEDGEFEEFTFTYKMSVLRKMDVVFWEPCVFEVKGTGFWQPDDEDYVTIRFPNFVRRREELDYRDILSFSELQAIGQKAIRRPSEVDMYQEVLRYQREIVESIRGGKVSSRSVCVGDDRDDMCSGTEEDEDYERSTIQQQQQQQQQHSTSEQHVARDDRALTSKLHEAAVVFVREDTSELLDSEPIQTKDAKLDTREKTIRPPFRDVANSPDREQAVSSKRLYNCSSEHAVSNAQTPDKPMPKFIVAESPVRSVEINTNIITLYRHDRSHRGNIIDLTLDDDYNDSYSSQSLRSQQRYSTPSEVDSQATTVSFLDSRSPFYASRQRLSSARTASVRGLNFSPTMSIDDGPVDVNSPCQNIKSKLTIGKLFASENPVPGTTWSGRETIAAIDLLGSATNHELEGGTRNNIIEKRTVSRFNQKTHRLARDREHDILRLRDGEAVASGPKTAQRQHTSQQNHPTGRTDDSDLANQAHLSPRVRPQDPPAGRELAYATASHVTTDVQLSSGTLKRKDLGDDSDSSSEEPKRRKLNHRVSSDAPPAPGPAFPCLANSFLLIDPSVRAKRIRKAEAQGAVRGTVEMLEAAAAAALDTSRSTGRADSISISISSSSSPLGRDGIEHGGSVGVRPVLVILSTLPGAESKKWFKKLTHRLGRLAAAAAGGDAGLCGAKITIWREEVLLARRESYCLPRGESSGGRVEEQGRSKGDWAREARKSYVGCIGCIGDGYGITWSDGEQKVFL